MENYSDNIISNTTFIVCDVETTGLSAQNDRIIEIALIKVFDGKIIDKFSSLVNPERFIPRNISEFTGITNLDVINQPTFEELSEKIISFIHEGKELNQSNAPIIFVGHNAMFDYKFLKESFNRNPDHFNLNLKTLCTCRLARRLLRKLRRKNLQHIAKYFDINMKRIHRAYDDAYATAKILLKFFEILEEEYEIELLEDLLRFQNTKIYSGNQISPALKRVKLSLKEIPKEPGVYFMKDDEDKILYIGKAKNLRERVSTYFNFNSNLTTKIKGLLTVVKKVEYEVTNSELSALILESKLIKRYKPKYNTAIKRFKFHPFIKIDIQNDYPRVEKVYEIENDGANYYGPFSSNRTVSQLLEDIETNFRLRKCDNKKFKPHINHSTCMYREIGKCGAPCNFSQSMKSYHKEVNKVHSFITSVSEKSAQRGYEFKMNELSNNMKYEEAAFYRDRLKDIQKVMSYQKVITSAINNKKIIIKCYNGDKKEIFFIHNGKLVNTYNLSKQNEVKEKEILNEIIETTEYLFFSLTKFATYKKYTREELDEIKVISNWLALNRDRNNVMEIEDKHTKEDVVRFVDM